MNAISSLSSFGARPTPGATFSSAQQAQRGTTYGSLAAARGGNVASTSSAYCPTCGAGASSARSSSSSYCPTCNTAGGRQSSITNFNSNSSASRTSAATTSAQQGGRVCVACAYQGR